MTLEPDSDPTHYCYRPLIEPYTSDANSATLQLVPPIPREGTLLIAHTEDGDYLFSLRVDKGRIVYQYTINETSTGTLSLATNLDLSNTTYQIDLTTTSNSAELVLGTVEGVVVTEVETREVVAVDTYPEGTIFTTVCVGGSLLEYANYVGTIRSAFYGFNSLLEEWNFCQLAIEGVSRSELIVFVDNGAPRSLSFDRFTLNNSIVSFEARLPTVNQGALLLMESSRYLLRITTISGQVEGGILPQITEQDNVWFNPDCQFIPVYDNEWHSFVITSNFSNEASPSVSILVDNQDTCMIASNAGFSFNMFDVNEALLTFANLPLSFGTTHESVNNGEELSTFHGCMNDFEFQSTSDAGVVFRPNLEAVPRESSEFDISSCYHCNSKMFCAGELVCTDRGFGLGSECDCPEGLTGETCGKCCHVITFSTNPSLILNNTLRTTKTYTNNILLINYGNNQHTSLIQQQTP